MGFFQSKILTLGVLVAVIFFAVSIFRVWPQKKAVESRLKNLESQISGTEQKNLEMTRLLDYFKSHSYLEREAKLKLNVRRPDENVVFIYENEKENNLKDENSLGFSGLEGLTNFEKWLKYLFE